MSETGIECEKNQLEIAQGEATHPQNTKPIDVRQLKRARSSAKGTLTKRQNELRRRPNRVPKFHSRLRDTDRAQNRQR
jgi:hypothetical protein